MHIGWLLTSALLAGLAPAGSGLAQPATFHKQRVTFASGSLTLVGYLYKPEGRGPFPALIWNHGSEPNPGAGPQFDSLAAIFVPAGYVVFAPVRRGQGDSQGAYIQDTIHDAFRDSGPEAGEHLMVRLMETEQLSDQLAGLAFVKTLGDVDTSRLVVAGCSYGGIQTLLAAERDVGFKAAFAISPGALSWSGHHVLQERLVETVRRSRVPVRLIQPPKDASLEPAKVLGAEARRLGKTSFSTSVYPATMVEPQRGHCFGGARGMRNWASEALSFFADALARRDPR
jgi:dienelactone hydrolase